MFRIVVRESTYRFTAPLQQQQPIETLEQERRRLMDRTQDRLPMVRQLPQEPDNVPCALAVETRGRFIKEEKQLRLASELYTNRQPLPCFDSKAQHQSISERLEFKEFKDFLHISVLLRFGDFVGLTQISREPQCFSNRCGPFVNVHLLSCFQIWISLRRTAR